MSGLRDIKKRISNVATIEKMSQSLKGMSTSKLASSKALITASKHYFETSVLVFKSLISIYRDKYLNQGIDSNSSSYKLCSSLLLNKKNKKTLLIFISSDKGLCGSYNNNINKAVSKRMLEVDGNIIVLPIGFKAYSFAKLLNSNQYVNIEIQSDLFKLQDNILEMIFYKVQDLFNNDEIDNIEVCYTKSHSILSQEVKIESLIEISNDKKQLDIQELEKNLPIITDEKELGSVLPLVIKEYFLNKLMYFICQSALAEHSSRLQAMDTAHQNSKELKEKLELEYNRTRQAIITKELIEIISGAEALD